jgi:hypothetical protein
VVAAAGSTPIGADPWSTIHGSAQFAHAQAFVSFDDALKMVPHSLNRKRSNWQMGLARILYGSLPRDIFLVMNVMDALVVELVQIVANLGPTGLSSFFRGRGTSSKQKN